ncbi:cation transporter [Halanaerobiaceae bacterium Z-7014]|uniref:Cation transporter n=1 Tax=Halonatronomonas betaini TaxID=2778430 RepID=A0A931AWI2_9FIRM|nr:cation transporter [Halonatronomonas betaini]MBF8437371.1 cation transporter [Halonatronomonas betaini]
MVSIKDLMEKTDKKESVRKEKLLRAAWMVSFLAPLSTFIAYYLGETPVLLAIFLRRTNEFMALFLAWVIYIKSCQAEVSGQNEESDKLEFLSGMIMGIVMIISGFIILYSAINQLINQQPPGWLIPGIFISVAGMFVNGFFWYKNYNLNKSSYSLIMDNQWKFYRAKTLMDIVVLISLVITFYDLLGERSWLSDPIGAIVVVGFIWFSAVQILYNGIKKRPELI